MDRKSTIKILREITRNLRDEDLFSSSDFVIDAYNIRSRVQQYIMKKLEL